MMQASMNESVMDILGYKDSFVVNKHVASVNLIDLQHEAVDFLSIMIPTYNRTHLLEQAILSAINQKTSAPYSIVVVDNNTNCELSTQVQNIAKRFRSQKIILYKNEANIGMYGNWNRCITLAKTEWITILNDDDLLLPNFVESSVSQMRKHPNHTMYAGNTEPLNQLCGVKNNSRIGRFRSKMKGVIKELIFSNESRLEPFDYFLGNPHCGSLGIVFSRKEALRLGGFDVDYFPSADYLFWTRYVLENKCLYYKEKVAKYRILENESLRPDVLDGWLKQGDEIRSALRPVIRLPQKTFEKYSLVANKEMLLKCTSQFGDRYNQADLIQKMGLQSVNHHRGKMMRFQLKIIYHLKIKSNLLPRSDQ
jgi:glycosyltransferase involved in cell wall biosynthesis